MIDKSDLIREAIAQANQNLEAAVRRGDTGAVSALYTENAMLLPTGAEPIEGTRAISDFWETVLQMGIKEIIIATREVDAQGATAIDLGEYTLRDSDAELIDRGKYIVIWKLIQGEWKIHRDIWNSSLSQG